MGLGGRFRSIIRRRRRISGRTISTGVDLRELCAEQRSARRDAGPVGERRTDSACKSSAIWSARSSSMQLDGTDAREFTKANEGMPYGLSLSPDGRRVAFHLATGAGYQVLTQTWPAKRARVAAKPGHLYFGTSWSPDGKWILYCDCQPGKYPDHEWADVCIGRADGSEHRVLTKGEPMWFAATYGDPKTRGSGYQLAGLDGRRAILFPRRLPDSRTAWEFQPQRPDVDHFNRDYKPERARGGTEICRLDPKSGNVTRLTHNEPPVWDFARSSRPTVARSPFAARPRPARRPSG